MDDEYHITVDELDEATCWRLAARAGFGRVAFVLDDEVMVRPVNVAVTWMTIEPSAVNGRMIHRRGHLAPSARVPYMPPD